MWDRTYEKRVRSLLEGVERDEVAAYEDLCRGFVDEYRALIRHWLFGRKGNMSGTIGDEAPEFGGARDALHFRYRKMEADLRELRTRQAKALSEHPFPGDKMLAALGREIDAFERAFSARP